MCSGHRPVQEQLFEQMDALLDADYGIQDMALVISEVSSAIFSVLQFVDISMPKDEYLFKRFGSWLLPSSVNDKESTLHCLNNVRWHDVMGDSWWRCHPSRHVISHFLSSLECFPCHSLKKVAVRKSINLLASVQQVSWKLYLASQVFSKSDYCSLKQIKLELNCVVILCKQNRTI